MLYINICFIKIFLLISLLLKEYFCFKCFFGVFLTIWTFCNLNVLLNLEKKISDRFFISKDSNVKIALKFFKPLNFTVAISNNFKVLSSEQLAINLLSGDQHISLIPSLCPVIVFSIFPSVEFHILTVLSELALAIYEPSGENLTEEIAFTCPCKVW